MREIVLDTETTGVDPASGHRVVEIGCVELIGGMRSGAHFHSYLNPERDMPEEAYRVHGLSLEFLIDKPLFAEKVDAFLEFIADAPLVIHNAAFDMKFINAELVRIGFPPIPLARATDTVLMARKKFPGSPASLDALCKRFNIDLSGRNKHGALLDAELLADVYQELTGGRQSALFADIKDTLLPAGMMTSADTARKLQPRAFPPSSQELAAHVQLLEKIKNPLWLAEEAN
jgi:DNA polymerase-3 subunit epsilon